MLLAKKCFEKMNLQHVAEKYKLVMSISTQDRKEALKNMLTPGNVIMFDGRPVCPEFLVKAFRFSGDLQCSVKGTGGAELKKRYGGTRRKGSTPAGVKDGKAVFLRRIAEQTGNRMPDTRDVHLPFYDKEVYGLFETQ